MSANQRYCHDVTNHWSRKISGRFADPAALQTQSEWESSDEDDELSSDGGRGGDEYANEFCEMPADFDEWGGPSYDLGASGGGGYY